MDVSTYTDSTWGQPRLVPAMDYSAYYPRRLPRTLDLSTDVVNRLTDAEAALGRLAGAGRLLPNPHLLIRPYLVREALSSARIEGTQASLSEVFDLQATGATPSADLEEVVNYIRALEFGITRAQSLPFSTRLMCEMHGILLKGVRGRDRQPGRVRTTQNWIGRPGATLAAAVFVPPPPNEVARLLSDWEAFPHAQHSIPVLIESALLHYQFETIHPFLDGNGRLGRLAIIFHLIMKERLPSPLLYLSSYFESHKDEYIAGLQAMRQAGDHNRWFLFFLDGIEAQANDAVTRAERLVDLREQYRDTIGQTTRGHMVGVVDVLFANPVITARNVEEALSVAKPTAIRMLGQLVDLEILRELSPGPRRLRRFVAHEVMAAIDDSEPTGA